MMIGTDSHTPNAGGLGMFASGVGGADAVDVMVGMPWEVLYPKIIGVRLTGEMSGWTAPKDVILKLCTVLTTKGGTNKVIEYFGPGVESISCTGKGTITNMGAELGATTSIFPYDQRMATYLKATGRADVVPVLEKYKHLLCADPEIEKDPKKYFDQVIEIDLSTLEPHVVGPHTPDLGHSISKLATDVKTEKYEDNLSSALIGSCTNSSYEDISRAADLAKQAHDAGLKMPIPFLITPGSEQIYETIKRDGQLDVLESIGGTVLANACGPCIGQWKRTDIPAEKPNSIITSFNRNFPKRNDGYAATQAFISSPEIVIALGLSGRLSFNPLKDRIKSPNGKEFRFKEPKKAPELPPKGFVTKNAGYTAPADDGASVEVKVDTKSDRLQLLDPFTPWDGKDYVGCVVLLKAKGKCTTDHISQAGPWLKYRGHLDNISDNMFIGAINAFTGEAGKGLNVLTKEKGVSFPKIARDYKQKKQPWVTIGDENYGEGSSREHAAMEPRHLGGVAIIARSFARIHETNLKKQGLLPLTFVKPADYDLIQPETRVDILGLKDLAPGKPVAVRLHQADGSTKDIQVSHSFSDDQLAWFREGSALNLIRKKRKS
jgi:aconitate hydratase